MTPYVTRLVRKTKTEPQKGPPDQSTRQADALLRIAETALAHEPTAMPAGERYQVVVHVDADALPEDGSGLRSHLDSGPHVPAETARRLSCSGRRDSDP
ncbi:MAG: DUF222 domain-containing protein [Myxococcales bacterium]|nr:DUF222 domain-containing protein [Myxococcales bacterium]